MLHFNHLDGRSPLWIASFNGHLDVVKKLIYKKNYLFVVHDIDKRFSLIVEHLLYSVYVHLHVYMCRCTCSCRMNVHVRM